MNRAGEVVEGSTSGSVRSSAGWLFEISALRARCHSQLLQLSIEQPGLLASLTDNFAGVVAHRQTSPESRDWLAKLMGTRSLWQMTSQTGAHGHTHTGR